jgi:hypothetical protein
VFSRVPGYFKSFSCFFLSTAGTLGECEADTQKATEGCEGSRKEEQQGQQGARQYIGKEGIGLERPCSSSRCETTGVGWRTIIRGRAGTVKTAEIYFQADNTNYCRAKSTEEDSFDGTFSCGIND